MNKHKFLMATPAITRKHTQVPAATREKSWDLPLPERWCPIPLHCVQSNALFPIKQIRSLDLLHGTTVNPPEIPHKSRRTLISPQESEIAPCSPHQLEMMTNSPVLPSEQCPFSHHTGQLAWLSLGINIDSLRHPSQDYKNNNFSTGIRGKHHAPNIVSRRELIPRILLKR